MKYRTWLTGTVVVILMMSAGVVKADESMASTNAVAPIAEATSGATATFMSPGGKLLSLSYGYVTSDYEDADQDAEGWRINGTFEMIPGGKPLAHGLTIGYIQTDAEKTVGAQTIKYDAKTIPVYYAPKLILGKKAVKVFAKGALGFHYSDYTRSGGLTGDVSADDFGFYGGVGLGAMVVLKEKFFINAEYEWTYLSNSYYQDGVVQSATIGVGARL